MFDRDDLPRPKCFDKPGEWWCEEDCDYNKALDYLFTGCNLQRNRNLANQATHHVQDAEDATHDYIASLFFARKTVAGFNPSQGTFESWHGTMFRFGQFSFLRVCCRKRERYGRTKLLSPEEWEILYNEIESGERGPDVEAGVDERVAALRECMKLLSKTKRDYVEDFYGCAGSNPKEHGEITNKLGISEDAGRRRLYLVRLQLRDCLKKRGFNF